MSADDPLERAFRRHDRIKWQQAKNTALGTDPSVPDWLNSTRQFISDAATTPREAGGIVGGLLDAGYGMAAPLARAVGAGDTADDLQRQRAILAQERANRLAQAEMSAPREWLNRNIPGAASSITQMATMAPAGFPGMVAGFAGTTADQAYAEGKEAGLGQTAAASYAGRQALAEAAPMVAFEGLGNFIPGMQGVESRFANALTGTGGQAVKQSMRQQAVGALKGLGGELLEENLTSALQSENTARSIPGRESENDYVGPDGSFFTSPMAKTFADTTGQTVLTMGLAETPTMAERARQMFDPAVQRYLKTPSRDNYKALPPEIKAEIVPGSDGTEEPNRGVRNEGRKKLEELRRKLEEEAAGAGLDPTEIASPVEMTPPVDRFVVDDSIAESRLSPIVDQSLTQGEASSSAPAEPVGASEPVAVHQTPIQVGDGNEAIRDVNEGRQGTEETERRQGRLEGRLLDNTEIPSATDSVPPGLQTGFEGSVLPSIDTRQSAMPVAATQDQGLAPSILAPAVEPAVAPPPSSFDPSSQATPVEQPAPESPASTASPADAANSALGGMLAQLEAKQAKLIEKRAKRQEQDAKLEKLNQPQLPVAPAASPAQDPRAQFESLPDGVKFTINHHIGEIANAAQAAVNVAKQGGDRYGWEVAEKSNPKVQDSIRRLGEVAQKIRENTAFDPEQIFAAAGMPDLTEFNRLVGWGNESASKPVVTPAQQLGNSVASETSQEIDDINSGKRLRDRLLSKIDEWVSHGTNGGKRPLDKSWERSAVKRLIEAEFQGLMKPSHGGSLASAKIAAAKATTFEQLKNAIQKIEVASNQESVSSESPAPAPQFTKGDTVIYRGEPWKIHDTSSPDGLVAITRKQGLKKRQVDRVEPQKLSLPTSETQDATESASAESVFKVGDIVNYNGSRHTVSESPDSNGQIAISRKDRKLGATRTIRVPVSEVTKSKAKSESREPRKPKLKSSKPQTLIQLIQDMGGIYAGSLKPSHDVKAWIENGLMAVFKNKTGGPGTHPLDTFVEMMMNRGLLNPPSNMKADDHLYELLLNKSASPLADFDAHFEAEYRKHMQELEDAKRAAAELGADSESIRQSEESGIQQADGTAIDDFIPQEERANQDGQATAQEDQSANEPVSHEDKLEYYRQQGYDLENEADWQRYIDDHGAPPDLGQSEMNADEDPFASSEQPNSVAPDWTQSSPLGGTVPYYVTNKTVSLPSNQVAVASEVVLAKAKPSDRSPTPYRLTIVEREDGDRHIHVEEGRELSGSTSGVSVQFVATDQGVIESIPSLNKAAIALWEKWNPPARTPAATGVIGVDGTQKTLFNKEPQGKLFNMEAPKKSRGGDAASGPSLLEQIDDEQRARSKASAPINGQKALPESPARFMKTVAPVPNQRFSVAAYGKNGVVEYYEIQSSALKDSLRFNTEDEAVSTRDKLESESRAKYSNQEYDKKFMSLGGLVQEDRARPNSASSDPGNLNREASGFRRADVGQSPKQKEPSPYANAPVAVPLALPELTELSEATTGSRPQMGHKLRSSLGVFKSMKGTWESKILVRPDLAHENDGNGGEQMLRTLSHEIGHSIDFNAKDEDPSVPNTMARGNILGRIGSMARYLKHTLTSSPNSTAGDPLSNKDRKALRRAAVREAGKDATPEQITAIYRDMVRDEMEKRDLLHVKDVTDELKALTRWWKPFDEDLVEKSYLRYRDSSEELFADAMSVLLNAPAELAERAPIFYHAMEEYLLRKPEVGQELFRLWDLSQQTPDQIAAHRGTRIVEGFQDGADAFKAAWEARHPDVSLKDKLVYALQEGLPSLLVDKYTGLKKRTRKVNDKAGEYLIDELFQKDAPQYQLAMETSNRIAKPLAEAGINDDVIGKYLLAYRIVHEETIPAKVDKDGKEITPTLYGRKDLANPIGMTYEASQEMLDAMKRELGDEKFKLLDSKMREWHRDVLWPVIEDAFKSGVYSESNRERLEKNKDAYAAFAVVKYITDNMSPMLRQQVGTFDDVGNPFHFTTLKMLSLIRLNQLNTAKRYVVNELLPQSGEVFHVEVPHGQYHPKGQPRHGYEFFHLLEDGKVTWREVPKFVEHSFANHDTSVLHRMGRALSSATYKVFHPLYVTFSPGFLMANPFRDLMRTYRNLGAKHGVSFRDVFKEWWKAIPEAKRFAATGFSDSVEKLIEHKAFSISFAELAAAKSEVVPFLPDIQESQSPVEKWIQDGNNPLSKFMRSLKRIGEIQEVATKIAADRLLEKAGVSDAQERAYAVRKYAGTPDWKQAGEITDISNSLFLYSRVKWNALQADADIAFDKQTAAGFWMRQAFISMLPTTLMKAGLYGGLAGLFGDDLEKLLKAIPKYMRDNYLVIPLPWNRGTAEHPKVDFITIPRDENSQFMAKLWGNFLDAGAQAAGVETQEASVTSALQHAALTTFEGIGGSVNPAGQVALAYLSYGTGSNPIDSHSQEPIIPKSTYEAGGTEATKKILQWSWDKTGALSQMTRFASGQIWGSPYEDREEPWFESLAMGAGQMTGLSKLIHTGADRGLQEFDWTQVEREKQRKARERLDHTTPAIRRLNTELAKLSGMGGDLTESQWLRKRTLSLWQSRHYDRVMDEVKHIGLEGSQPLIEKLDLQARSLIDADSQMPDEFLPSILMQATEADDGKNGRDIENARRVAADRGLTKQQAIRMLFAESRRVAQLRENAAAKKLNRKPRVMPQPEMSDAMAKRIRALKFLN